MLNSEMHFGFRFIYEILFLYSSDPVDSAIFKNAVECPKEFTCLKWAGSYHNISTIFDDLNMGYYCGKENCPDVYNIPAFCALEDGVVRTFDYSIWMRKRSPFLELINDVISHIVEGGISMHIKKRGFERAKIQTELNFPTANDKYSVYTVSHLQTAFCLLMLGYVLAVACFVTEIMWHRYRSKGRKGTSTALCHRHT
jgi:hypothetical protein